MNFESPKKLEQKENRGRIFRPVESGWNSHVAAANSHAAEKGAGDLFDVWKTCDWRLLS
jgi:hypothetical protein